MAKWPGAPRNSAVVNYSVFVRWLSSWSAPRRPCLLEDDVEEDEDMVKRGESAVHLTSLFLERLRLFGM